MPGMQHCNTPAHGAWRQLDPGARAKGVGTSTAATVFFLTSKKQTTEFRNNEKEKRSEMLMKAKTAK